jgi:hypothetical protein
MSGYDIIGDVHGCADKLVELLGVMGYAVDDRTGAYAHPLRQAIFVGDLIDRGPGQLDVLEIVKQMVDHGTAQIVMGNHEFNAINYATEHPVGSGHYLRPRSDKNAHQHAEFLAQVTGDTREQYLNWFKTLPLWLDLDGVRIVHACWHQPSIDLAAKVLGGNRFTSSDQFVRASDKNDPLYAAIEIILKGPELSLTDHGQAPFVDKDGHPRDKARVAWWMAEATTLRDLAVMNRNFHKQDGRPYPDLPYSEVDALERSYCYRADIPVVYGHYWRTGTPERGQDWTSHTACVDFSAVNTGDLVAYRWNGEHEIRPDHYAGVGI